MVQAEAQAELPATSGLTAKPAACPTVRMCEQPSSECIVLIYVMHVIRLSLHAGVAGARTRAPAAGTGTPAAPAAPPLPIAPGARLVPPLWSTQSHPHSPLSMTVLPNAPQDSDMQEPTI